MGKDYVRAELTVYVEVDEETPRDDAVEQARDMLLRSLPKGVDCVGYDISMYKDGIVTTLKK